MISIFSKKPDNILTASRKEQIDAIERLISQGEFKHGYYLFLVLSALIITPGLLLDNVSVIIGGMILAPFMVPILSLSLSLVSGSVTGILRSLKILGLSIVVTLLASALLTLVLSHTYNVVSWIPDRISPGIYIFIAFCSGVAGAFAWVKEDMAPMIAGVAISVSLLPPLCAAGIGIALLQWTLVKNSLVLLTANVIGICLAAFFVFWILGFLTAGKVEEKVLEKVE